MDLHSDQGGIGTSSGGRGVLLQNRVPVYTFYTSTLAKKTLFANGSAFVSSP